MAGPAAKPSVRSGGFPLAMPAGFMAHCGNAFAPFPAFRPSHEASIFPPTCGDLARFWLTDWDRDGTAFGAEHALGTDPLAPGGSAVTFGTATGGSATIAFPTNPGAGGILWRVTRSTDLLGYTEIVRFDGTTNAPVGGIAFTNDAWPSRSTTRFLPALVPTIRFEALLE